MMSFYFVFILYITIATVVTQQQQAGNNCSVEFVDKTNDGKPRLTMLQEGNYTIQALLQFSEKGTFCQNISRSGLISMYAIQYAINKFNLDSNYSRYATVGLQLDDDCGQLPRTMARGIEIVSFHRNNSICRSDFLGCHKQKTRVSQLAKKSTAIIGTSFSFTSIPLSSLMSLYDIPQVSPSASSRLLSKKDLYKSFFRTIPSDTNQISAMIDLFKEFKWNYIFAIGSDDDYGKLGIAELQQKTSDTDICIYKDEYIPYQSANTDAKVKEVVKKIEEGHKATVVVLFLYVDGIGDKILKSAQKKGIKRIWLTSEAWNPSAMDTFNKEEYRSIRNQTHGIVSVSLKRHSLDYLFDFIESEIANNSQCNKWLQQYVSHQYDCQIDSYDSTNKSFSCSNKQTELPLTEIVDDLRNNMPGLLNKIIDAATSLCHAMYSVIRQRCKNSPVCNLAQLESAEVTKAMESVNFLNEQNETVSFINGDPAVASYTIENLVLNNGKLKYVEVGHWDSNILVLNKEKIQWPVWFNESKTESPGSDPVSRCMRECEPGEKVVGRSACCWDCHNCGGNNYTNKRMEKECKPCGKHKHTIDNIRCIDTPIEWLKLDDSTGMSIVVVSLVGFLITICATMFICRYRNLVSIHDTSPHLLTLVCIILFLTFIYGPLHVVRPTNLLCQVRNSYFFVLLMMYCSFVLVKTQAMTSYLRTHAERSFNGMLLVPQLIVLLLFFLLEAVSVAAWLSVDGLQVEEFPEESPKRILMQCAVDFTAARLVSTFIPCIILIIATFCAFRERNADHSFYEPKFLSFSCIALCIIIVAFLPTFRYVRGIYKAIVLAFTMNVFGYTFMACLILPKLYVGVMRKRRGINEYPMKEGASKRKGKKKSAHKKKNKGDDNICVLDTTKTTMGEATSEMADGIDSSYVNLKEGEFDEKVSDSPAAKTTSNGNPSVTLSGYSNGNGISSSETTKV